jgi:hypothetical protein
MPIRKGGEICDKLDVSMCSSEQKKIGCKGCCRCGGFEEQLCMTIRKRWEICDELDAVSKFGAKTSTST